MHVPLDTFKPFFNCPIIYLGMKLEISDKCSVLDLEIQSRIKSGTIWHDLGLFYPRLFCESRFDLRLILDYIWVYNLISYLG